MVTSATGATTDALLNTLRQHATDGCTAIQRGSA
jgi:hypothetical protein